jgi:hypothetical protein
MGRPFCVTDGRWPWRHLEDQQNRPRKKTDSIFPGNSHMALTFLEDSSIKQDPNLEIESSALI